MKKATCAGLVLLLLLGFLHSFPAMADTGVKAAPVSGAIAGGFRVLDVPEGSSGLALTVYRGDYIKFKLADPAAETIVSIPDLSVHQKVTGKPDAAPFFKMEKTGVFAFALGTATGSIAVIDYQQANYREVSVKEAEELIRNIAPLVLDVRTAAEFSRGHLKASVPIPLQQLQARWPEISGHKNKDVLIYCATGNRSTVAAKILIDNGFKRIFNLRQGISGWEREKLPVVQ